MKPFVTPLVALGLVLHGAAAQTARPPTVQWPTVQQQTIGTTSTAAGVGVLTITPPDRGGLPVLMLPGLGLSSALFLGLDGTGWAHQFVAAGHPVHVTDGPGSVRGVAPGSVPGLFTWNPDQVWSRWGLGPKTGVPYDNGRFPVERFGEFLNTLTPVLRGPAGGAATGPDAPPAATRQSRAGRQGAGAAEPAGAPAAAADRAATAPIAPDLRLLALLERTGPAVIIAHSASGETAFDLARARPDLVRGLIVVEPVGCPGDADGLNIPLMTLFGDHLESRNMTGRLNACLGTTAALSVKGLPTKNLRVSGFSHLMMLERGSEELAGEMLAWIRTLPGPARR